MRKMKNISMYWYYCTRSWQYYTVILKEVKVFTNYVIFLFFL